jgi:hypothetical protein
VNYDLSAACYLIHECCPSALKVQSILIFAKVLYINFNITTCFTWFVSVMLISSSLSLLIRKMLTVALHFHQKC